MDNKDILFSIMNTMSFRETLIFGQVNRMIHGILDTEEYWSYRSSGITVSNDPFLSDPKVKYAWTIASGFHDSKDFRDSIIYLSTRKDLLFPGLELIIGFREFVFRSVRQNNLELTKYVVSLGIPYSTIDEAGQLAVELNFKSIAEFLCSIVPYWKCNISFHARYSAEPSCQSQKCIIDLVKYGKYDRSKHMYEHAYYACGLVEKYAIAQTDRDKLQIENEFIELLEKQTFSDFWSLFRISDDFDKIGKYLTRGSTKMIDVFLNGGIDMRDLLMSAICADDVPLMKQIMKHIIKRKALVYVPYGAEIRSVEMYNIVKEIAPYRSGGIFEAVLRGGNYQLFYRMIKKEPMSRIADLNYACPLMLVEIIRRYGDEYLDVFQCSQDKDHLSPYLYNLLRSHGLPKDVGIVADLDEHVRIERYPYLLADLDHDE